MKPKLCAATLLFLIITASEIFGQWIQMNGPAGHFVTSFASNKEKLFVGTMDSGMYFTTDVGKNWTECNKGLSFPHIFSLAFKDSTLYAATNGGGIFQSTNFGVSWIPKNSGLSQNRISSIGVFKSDLFAGGYFGEIFKSTDEGTDWVKLADNLIDPIDSSVEAGIFAFLVIDSDLYVGTYGGGVFLTTNQGASWNATNSGLTGLAQSIQTFGLLDTMIFAGTEGGVFLSQNNGLSWTPVNFGLTNTWVNSLMVHNNILIAGTYGNGVFVSKNNGESWVDMSDGLSSTALNVYSLSVKDSAIFLGTYAAGVWRRPLSDFGISDVKYSPQPNLNISLSPNPTTGIIAVHNAPANILHVTITNVLGETVSEVTNSGAADFTIDLSKLPPGTYFARFAAAGSVITRKIIRE